MVFGMDKRRDILGNLIVLACFLAVGRSMERSTQRLASPASPAEERHHLSCMQQNPVGMGYYPNIKADCPPPVIDEDQWIADTLMAWFHNQTDAYWNLDLDIRPYRNKKKMAITSSSPLDYSLEIIATTFIPKGERLAFIPADLLQLDQELELVQDMISNNILFFMMPSLVHSDHCDDRDVFYNTESTATLLVVKHGLDLLAGKDIPPGTVLFPCSFLDYYLEDGHKIQRETYYV